MYHSWNIIPMNSIHSNTILGTLQWSVYIATIDLSCNIYNDENLGSLAFVSELCLYEETKQFPSRRDTYSFWTGYNKEKLGELPN